MFGELHRKPYNNECKPLVTEAPITHICTTSDEEERDAVDLCILRERSDLPRNNKEIEIYLSNCSDDGHIELNGSNNISSLPHVENKL